MKRKALPLFARHGTFYALALLLAAAADLLPVQGRGAEREFFSGYVGTLPPAESDRAGNYFQRPEARHLLSLLEMGPLTKARAEAAMSATPTQLSDLLRMHLVREERGLIRVGFPYFTASDMNKVHAVAAHYVPSLVAAYKSNHVQIAAILERYPMASVNRKRLAFVLIAGVSLNWDALELLEEKGYRQIDLVHGDGWQYGFWASEAVPDYSYQGFYWGSSTFPADALNLTPPLDFAFSSFGDALSEPRMNLPDLLALPPEDMTPAVIEAAQVLGLHDDNELNMNLKNVIGLFQARDLGDMLFAMRRGATSADQICGSPAAANRSCCTAKLGLLLAIGYARARPDGKYELTVPVFDAVDKGMLDDTLTVSRNIIERWLSDNYANIRRDLSNLTAVQQGVPYPVMFTQIWHELFGLTTRELAAKGLIENPRDPSVIWRGSIPMVWRIALYSHKFE